MSGVPKVRAFELVGEHAAAALDWLYVHADVQGVVEGHQSFVVYLNDSLPALPVDGVGVRELVVDPAALAITGLENDAPTLVADDLLVRPPWVERPPDFHGVELIVPRGGAFGSGEHASTRAALRCLHELWRDTSPASLSFADVGTGSGILALYASVRGCLRIEACDIDAPSVAAASELLPNARVALGGAELLQSADAVIANMTAAELTSSIGAILAIWNRRGVLVLSGMRRHEVDGVLALVPALVVRRETVGEFSAVGFAAAAAPTT